MQLQRELEVAERIARGAGDILRGFYRGEYDVGVKAGEEPVTEADRAANEYIVRALREEFPNDGILAEESSDIEGVADAARIWMVDPMDGTREFIDHTDEFAVMIGLAIEGLPVLGVVMQPATDVLYRGIVGEGAQEVRGTSVAPLVCNATADFEKLRLIVSRSHMPKIVRQIADDLGIQDFLRSGSVGLKIGKISTGICDVYVHPVAGTKLWDACAPEAVLHAAGGRITDCDGNPLVYDPGNLINERGLLASNGSVHEQLVDAVSAYY